MHELLKRYLSKLPPEDLPDLLLVDGGKGQLNVALSALEELKMKGMDVVALAKGGKGKKLPKGQEKIRREKFFLPRRKEPLLLPKNSPALFLLQRIRDESHRFAISYHKKLRKLRDFRSILDDIPGIGPVKKKELLRHFGSIKNIKNASIEEILDTPKINQKDAQKLFCFFRKK
jgi:excinuclease ABC subunit C